MSRGQSCIYTTGMEQAHVVTALEGILIILPPEDSLRPSITPLLQSNHHKDYTISPLIFLIAVLHYKFLFAAL